MSVAIAGRSPQSFEIKSASLPLLTLRLKSGNLDLLTQELQTQYGDIPNFFDDESLVLDLSTLPAEEAKAPLDYARLRQLLLAHRLYLRGICGGTEAQNTHAKAEGLWLASDLYVGEHAPSLEADTADAASTPTPEAKPAPVELPPPSGALVIQRPLRAGQQVYARGRDLVVLGAVNPGAEVIADGHIHVYAALRGRALAGARGWAEARIFALDMRPDLLSIAGIYRTGEELLPPSIYGKPAWVHLASSAEAGDKLIFEPLTDKP